MRKTHAALFLIALTYFSAFFFFHRWNQGSLLNGGDSFGYYAYLPAIFIHHDIDDLRKSTFVRDSHRGATRDTTKPITDMEVTFSNTTPVIKYTCGIALLESPAFFTAHALALLSGAPADGYSPIYMFCVHLWNVLVVLLGLLVLARFLKQFFSDGVSALLLIAIAIGTNLFYFSVYNMGMSHGYLFALYALLLLYSAKLYRAPVPINFIMVGLSAGLITLIRPNEIFCLVIPLLYGFSSPYELVKRIRNYIFTPGFYLAILVFVLCGLPQLLYWKTVSGHFVYYSYANEGFDFRHPHIWEGLFGYTNGWIPYSPVMLFAIAGLPLLLVRRTGFLVPLLAFMPVHIYIIYSWWCWTYVNGLGSRPMVETYPLLALPMGLLFTELGVNRVGKLVLYLLLPCLIAFQVLLTYKSSTNVLWSEGANRQFYYQTLLKTRLNMNDMLAYDLNQAQPVNPVFVQALYKHDFNDTTANTVWADGTPANGAFLLNEEHNYMNVWEGNAGVNHIAPCNYLKVSFDARNLPPGGSLYKGATMVVQFRRNQEIFGYHAVRISNKLPVEEPFGIWRFNDYAQGRISFYIKVPARVIPTDTVQVYGTTNTNAPVVIDNVAVEVWATP